MYFLINIKYSLNKPHQSTDERGFLTDRNTCMFRSQAKETGIDLVKVFDGRRKDCHLRVSPLEIGCRYEKDMKLIM